MEQITTIGIGLAKNVFQVMFSRSTRGIRRKSCPAEGAGIAQQGGHVPEQDAGLGIIGHAADRCFQPVAHVCAPSTRPATASSLAIRAGSRAEG